jgi:protein ImuB
MFGVVSIPQFPLQAVLRHEPELWSKPVALVDNQERAPVICDTTEPARATGITPGCTPTQAMARCREILLRERSSRHEEAATAALLQTAYAFSPYLESTGPGVCTLDLHDLAALKDADRSAQESWARRLQHALAALQLSAAIGLGPTPIVARHAARWGGGIEIVHQAELFIAGLPLAALEPSPDIALRLKSWGIRTVAEMLALGQEAVVARLGLEAFALCAAASCSACRPLHLVQPSETYEESFDLDPPVETLEPLLFLLRRFVDQLSHRLEPHGLVAESLLLQIGLESGQKVTSQLRLPHPTRDANVLFRTLHTHLETVRTDSPVKAVGLCIAPTESREKQLGLFETVLSNPQQFRETLARLAAVLGADRVGTPVLENSHQPDRFRLDAPDFENAPVPEPKRRLFGEAMPIRRFRPAIKADVECEPVPARPGSSRPVSIRCALTQGRLKILVGPWRASGHWWEPEGWEREEWDASTSDGQVIRLVHQPEGWFVEGVID